MAVRFTADDLRQIAQRGMKPEIVKAQVQHFIEGFPPITLVAPANVKHGIQQITPRRIDELTDLYADYCLDHKVVKFVPASGAASRLFKHLFEFRSTYRGTNQDQLALMKDKGPDSVYYFFENLKEFAFFPDLDEALDHRGLDFDHLMNECRYEKILNTLLTDKGLAYGNLPKALIPFHRYGDDTRTSFAEHLVEGAHYARSGKNIAHIHFTTLPQHLDLMKGQFDRMKKTLEEAYNVSFQVTFSIQDSSTDMIAVDLDNQPVRDEQGQLVFRPGGHGSLLNNLSSIEADLIIIKNIDNVCHDRFKEDTIIYKKVLAGKLISYQEQIFAFLHGLDHPTPPSMKVVEAMWFFVEHKLRIIPPEGSENWKKEEKIDYLKRKLNRPIRVCGIVENEGEPGGGPFWVKNADGTTSLQIVESSQIDHNDAHQEEIFKHSTHFNPVDIVCSTRDYQGNPFDLSRFVDPATGFISQKSLDGKTILAQELPGLWNGSMSDWITAFVEVPLSTFNPVKIINDLLREEHMDFS